MKRLLRFLPVILACSLQAMEPQDQVSRIQRRALILAQQIMPQEADASSITTQECSATRSYVDYKNLKQAQQQMRGDSRIKKFEMLEYVPLILKVSSVENQYPNHYSFVHAHSKELKPLHDLYREMMRLNGTPLRDNWVPLRRQADLCPLSVKEYITKHDMKKESNYHGDHQKNLLSVNFSVPGNMYGPESSLRYFAADHSVEIPQEITARYLSDVLLERADFGLRALYFKLHYPSIKQLLDSKEGVVIQLLIPKKDIDTYAYLALGAGHVIPFKIQLKDGSELPGFDAETGCYSKISPFLDIYEKNIGLLDTSLMRSRKDTILDTAQARIVLHKDLFNRDDIIMHTHMNIAQEKLQKYYAEIERYARKIMQGDSLELTQDIINFLKPTHMHHKIVLQAMHDFIKKGMHHQEIFTIAQQALKIPGFEGHRAAYDLLKLLIEKGHYQKELLIIGKELLMHSEMSLRKIGIEIVRLLVDNGYYYKEIGSFLEGDSIKKDMPTKILYRYVQWLNHVVRDEKRVGIPQTKQYSSIIHAEKIEKELRHTQFNPDFSVAQYTPLITAVSEFEEQNPQCYSFVHGFSKGRLPVYDLYSTLAAISGKPLRDNWIPVRRVQDLCELSVADYLTMKMFIKEIYYR